MNALYIIFLSFISLCILGAIIYLVVDEIKRRREAEYIRDRRDNTIHKKGCSRIDNIPVFKRQYMDHWDLQHQKQLSPTLLKEYRLCGYNH